MHGIGLFAEADIPSGSRLWSFDQETMFAHGEADLLALERRDLRYALHGGYLHRPSGRFLWYRDGMERTNHAPPPRASMGSLYWPELEDEHCIAVRDIKAGEEIFEDYGYWSFASLGADHWVARLVARFHPRHYAFMMSLGRARGSVRPSFRHGLTAIGRGAENTAGEGRPSSMARVDLRCLRRHTTGDAGS